MQSNNLYNGREAEVIVQFNDGYSYCKSKLEASLASLRDLMSERKQAKSTKAPVVVKKEDIDYIVKEFDISQALAEKVLTENSGDLDKALRALVAS